MPLFFLIAIGAGAFALGATTVDVVNDGQLGQTNQFAQTSPAPTFQASAYPTLADCLDAAAKQGVPAQACQNR